MAYEMTFKKMPPFDEVCLLHPDGMYLKDDGDVKSIIIVGPMHFSPIEIAELFHRPDSCSFEVTEMRVLHGISDHGSGSTADYAKRLALHRGFILIKIEKMKENAQQKDATAA